MKANKKLILSSVIEAFKTGLSNMNYAEVKTLRKNLEAAKNLDEAADVIDGPCNEDGYWYELQVINFNKDYVAEISRRYAGYSEVAWRLSVEFDRDKLYEATEKYHWITVKECERMGDYDTDKALLDTFTARELLKLSYEEAMTILMNQTLAALDDLRKGIESWYATVEACKELLDERWKELNENVNN